MKQRTRTFSGIRIIPSGRNMHLFIFTAFLLFVCAQYVPAQGKTGTISAARLAVQNDGKPQQYLLEQGLLPDTRLPRMMNRFSALHHPGESVLGSQLRLIDTAIVTGTTTTTRHYNVFSETGKLTFDVTEQLVSGEWKNYQRDVYMYDITGNITSHRVEQWVSTDWQNFRRYTYVYDALGNMVSQLKELWSVSYWVISAQYGYTYDVDNHLLSQETDNWSNGQWANATRVTFHYNISGYQTSSLTQHWIAGDWADYLRVTNVRNGNNLLLTALNELWTNGQWVNYCLYTSTYDVDGNPATYSSENWIGGVWVGNARSTYTHNIQGSRTSELYEVWTNNLWVNYLRRSYSYNGENNITGYTAEQWLNNGWFPVNWSLDVTDEGGNSYSYNGSEITLHYQSLVLGVGERSAGLVASFSLYQNQPNPFNPITIIGFSLGTVGNVTLNVYNVLGQEVAILVNNQMLEAGKHTVKFDASNFSSGVYFCRLNVNGAEFTAMKRMVLLK